MPAAYRGAQDTVRELSLGEARWTQVFRDTVLQDLIDRALRENNDIRIAATRIDQARAQLRIRRADQFPQLTGSVTAERERTPELTEGGIKIPSSTENLFDINLMLSWEIDFGVSFAKARKRNAHGCCPRAGPRARW